MLAGFSSIISGFQEAFSDWLKFLQSPAEATYEIPTGSSEDWRRLFRLIGLTSLMVLAILTLSYIGLSSAQRSHSVAEFLKNGPEQLLWAIIIIVAGALLACLYKITMAPLFGITITLPQSFFTFLFLGLPWVPIATFVYVLAYIMPLLVLLIILFLFIFLPLVVAFRFGQGIVLASGCQRWRCYTSVYAPLLVIGILLFLFVFKEYDPAKNNFTMEPSQETSSPEANKKPELGTP